MGRGQRQHTTQNVALRGDAPAVTVTLYRAGALAKAPAEGQLAQIITAFDRRCPPGRAGRGNGLFVCADLPSAGRWVSANSQSGVPFQPHEVTYTGPEPYVYPVLGYERACSLLMFSNDPERRAETIDEFWRSGVPLSVFERDHAVLTAEPLWREGHEILIAPEMIKRARAVSWKRMIAAAGSELQARVFDRLRLEAQARKRAAQI